MKEAFIPCGIMRIPIVDILYIAQLVGDVALKMFASRAVNVHVGLGDT
jgi:hypothetical protein